MTLDTLRRDLRALRVELAAARLTGVLRHWGATSADERKYDPHAAHQPAGTRVGGRGGGGQFAPKGGAGGGALRGVAAQAARAALADPQALAAAGPGAAALAAGGVAVSRQAGLYAHYMDGQAITPILHLPGGKLETGPPPLSVTAAGRGGQTGRYTIGQFSDDCDEQAERDIQQCRIASGSVGGYESPKGRRKFARCLASVYERQAQCVRGGVGAISIPLFFGG